MADNVVFMTGKIGGWPAMLYPGVAGKPGARIEVRKRLYFADFIGFSATLRIFSAAARGSRQAGDLLVSENIVVMRKIAVFVAALMVASSVVATTSPAFAGAYTTTIKKCNAMTNATQKKQCTAQAQKTKTVALKQCSAIKDAAKKKSCITRAS